MRKLPSILNIRVVIASTSFLLLIGCGSEVDVQTEEQPIRPAKLVVVADGSNERQVRFPAVIEANSTSELSFAVGGEIEEILIREGQQVAQNELIARLGQRSYLNDLAAAQSQYDSAQTEYNRARRLIAENAIARKDFDQRKSQRDVARNTLDNAQKAVDDTELRAPFAGVVADVLLDEFQNASPGTVIAILQSIGDVQAVIQAPATLVANSGSFEPIDTFVTIDSVRDARIPAVFHSAAAQADQSTQTFEVKFAFSPPEKLVILPGMTGTVESRLRVIGDEASAKRVEVPLTAIAADGDDKYAWLVDTETMTVSRRDIVVGSGIGESLSILEGLEAGDTIVGAGMSYLHEGMQIRPYEQ